MTLFWWYVYWRNLNLLEQTSQVKKYVKQLKGSHMYSSNQDIVSVLKLKHFPALWMVEYAYLYATRFRHGLGTAHKGNNTQLNSTQPKW